MIYFYARLRSSLRKLSPSAKGCKTFVMLARAERVSSCFPTRLSGEKEILLLFPRTVERGFYINPRFAIRLYSIRILAPFVKGDRLRVARSAERRGGFSLSTPNRCNTTNREAERRIFFAHPVFSPSIQERGQNPPFFLAWLEKIKPPLQRV